MLIFNEGQVDLGRSRRDRRHGSARRDFTIPGAAARRSRSVRRSTTCSLAAAGDSFTCHDVQHGLGDPRRPITCWPTRKRGNDDRVVVQGSHLDSVIAGPGIQDNGSGSAYNLESAIQIAKKHIKPRNTIRFAWWGAEELNLLGSTHYVNSLSDADFAKIALNLNHDMIASPNFVRFVYDGDGSDTPAAGPPGSAQIEQVFLNWFQSQGLATDADGVRRRF